MAIGMKLGVVGLLSAGALVACASNTSGTTALNGADKITASMEGQTAPDGSIVKCRSMQVTGSRFPAKDCKSELAWKEFDRLMAENAKNETDKFQRLNTGCSTTGTC
ncbi:hypothetical protein K1X12_03690 [Hyphomonas sp. WL0036]|uniref:hypothetical protein n=1 Tax=Hyphomonas sediminis TaxID=2866160 RepID=UPI001C809E56|nr:hypothetical protein [Hyphomonas sediminis]MBY9065984.1 hypothetical protein [Hyphomonas sediminis]